MARWPEHIGLEDPPRGSRVPRVDFAKQDLQDRSSPVTAQTVARDYVGTKFRGRVYRAWVPVEDMPPSYFNEEETDWSEFQIGRHPFPPIKLYIYESGEMSIADGNHRAYLWGEQGYTHIPCWVIDARRPLSTPRRKNPLPTGAKPSALVLLLRETAEPVDVSTFAYVLEASEPWSETTKPERWLWRLARNVPIELLRPQTADCWLSDEDLTEEEAEENVDRYERIRDLLRSGAPLWPVVVDERGMTLDGYHRLAAAYSLDEEATVDVLWASRERPATKANPYVAEVLAARDYLRGGIDPFDFAFLLEDYFKSLRRKKPKGFDPDDPLEWLYNAKPSAIVAFKKWLEDGAAERYVAGAQENEPAYMYLGYKRLLSPSTWLVHFTGEPLSVAQHGFIYGEQDLSRLAMSTLQGYLGSSRLPKEGIPGWGFAFQADSRDASNTARSHKYGRQAVLFRSAGVLAYHHGDSEYQVIFWGPAVRQIIPLYSDGHDEWQVTDKHPGRRLVSGDFEKVVGWVIQNYDQYRRRIAFDPKRKAR